MFCVQVTEQVLLRDVGSEDCGRGLRGLSPPLGSGWAGGHFTVQYEGSNILGFRVQAVRCISFCLFPPGPRALGSTELPCKKSRSPDGGTRWAGKAQGPWEEGEGPSFPSFPDDRPLVTVWLTPRERPEATAAEPPTWAHTTDPWEEYGRCSKRPGFRVVYHAAVVNSFPTQIASRPLCAS